MTAGRDITLLIAGAAVGIAMGYFFRNAIAKILGGASATQALFANTLPYSYMQLQGLSQTLPGQGVRPAFTNNTIPLFFGGR